MGRAKDEWIRQQEEQEKELMEVNPETGEISISGEPSDMKHIKVTKVKAFQLLHPSDFCLINGVYEAKRDGLIKLLSCLPVSYQWRIKEKRVDNEYSEIHGELTVTTGSVNRIADGLGICERKELNGSGGLHFMNARAETRALKRAIETIFGSVINYYVVNHLEQRRVA